MRDLKLRLLLLLAGALVVAGALGWRVYQRIGSLRANTAQMDTDHQLITRLEAVLRHVALAQAGQRDFILTSDPAYLESCQRALTAVGENLQAMRKLGGLGAHSEKIDQMDPLLVAQVGFFNRSFILLRQQGRSAAAAALSRDSAADSLERINRLAASMIEDQALQRQRRSATAEADDRALSVTLILGSGVIIILVLAVPLLLRREIRRRTLAETELARASAELKAGVQRLERNTFEINQLSSFAEAVQACQNVAEFVGILGPLVQPLFGGLSGSVSLLNPSKTGLSESVRFGTDAHVPATFQPDDCWAIRRGQTYLVNAGRQVPLCAHVADKGCAETFCLPLTARSDLLGLFFLTSDSPGGLDEGRQKLAIVVAEQMSLALANLTLLERLQLQSSRDPLTGLFNRRYMEEQFERMKAECAEKNAPLGLVMADIDHFKAFNDAHGHDAGDHVLKQVSQVLQTQVRAQDLLCRFGGEEMLMLFPGLNTQQTVQRAEQCRKAVEAHKLLYQNRELGRLTISLGVAVFPQDGDGFMQLAKRADQALYRAKDSGRNQVAGATPAGS